MAHRKNNLCNLGVWEKEGQRSRSDLRRRNKSWMQFVNLGFLLGGSGWGFRSGKPVCFGPVHIIKSDNNN
jgi:hypothetical protein